MKEIFFLTFIGYDLLFCNFNRNRLDKIQVKNMRSFVENVLVIVSTFGIFEGFIK